MEIYYTAVPDLITWFSPQQLAVCSSPPVCTRGLLVLLRCFKTSSSLADVLTCRKSTALRPCARRTCRLPPKAAAWRFAPSPTQPCI